MEDEQHTQRQAKFLRGLASELAARGATKDGIAWVLGALDPAHANFVTDAPTHDATPVARPQFVQTTTIDAGDYDGAWDCCLVTYGGDNTHCVFATAKSGADFTNPSYGSGFITQGTFTAVQPGAPVISDLVQVVGAGPNPLSNAHSPLARDITMGRSVSRSLTIDYTGPTLEDGGTVVAAHFNSFGGNTAEPVLRNIGILSACYAPVIALEERNFPTSASMFYAGAARDGIYMPQRVGTSSYGQVYVPNGLPIAFPGAGMYLPPDQPVGARLLPSDPGLVPGTGTTPSWFTDLAPTCDSFIDSTQLTVVIFRGLQPGASLLVKGVLSLAVVPRPSSLERPYVVPAVCEDPIAIEAYTRMLAALPAAWPSRYNFLGALGGVLASLGRAIWPILAPVARQVGVSLVGSAADEATRRIVQSTTPQQVAPATHRTIAAPARSARTPVMQSARPPADRARRASAPTKAKPAQKTASSKGKAKPKRGALQAQKRR